MPSRTILLLLLSLLPGPLLCAEEPLQAGAARIDITPPTGFPLWGYSIRKDAPSTGVLDPLQARALVLAVGKQKLALVSLDLGRAPTLACHRNHPPAVAEGGHRCVVPGRLAQHHGPVLELDGWPTPETSYVRALEKKLVDVVLQANRDLRPAHLGVAGAAVPFNRNRHSRRAEKPVDPELLVLRVEDHKGKPIAHAVNFAAHPTMLEARVRSSRPITRACWPA